jgi:acyl-CoA synthetase (AMP-forming)/AMP-acid ligase II
LRWRVWGAILVPVNPDYGVREAAYVLDHAGVKGVVATADKLDIVTAALAQTQPHAWMVSHWCRPGYRAAGLGNVRNHRRHSRYGVSDHLYVRYYGLP